MSTATATVETLTAEVRVLMVGNRQVTLSVYRQLDEVIRTHIEPFGRVNDKTDYGLWVVGRHTETGALVRCHPSRASITGWSLDLKGWCTVHSHTEWDLQGVLRAKVGDLIVAVEHRDLVKTECSAHSYVTQGGECPKHKQWWFTSDVHEAAAVNEAVEIARCVKEQNAFYESCDGLPLIVLAGLR